MRDPYDVLGLSRQATFDEVKAAYRRACKTKHPDMGGSQEAFVELQNAYEAILTDLKNGYQTKPEKPQQDRAAPDRDADRRERTYRDIDEELEELRRNARVREEALRTMRSQLWEQGDTVAWARFTWRDVSRFFTEIMHSGVKGLALLCAALIGIGSVLVEANAVSAIIMFGAGIGFVFSQALKSDKGGMLSAGVLLFGIMTIWLPPVRQALVHYPLATISLLLCLALIFKFGQQGGMVGLMTGGFLTLYVVGSIITQTQQQERQVVLSSPGPVSPIQPPSPKQPLTTTGTTEEPPKPPPLPPPPPEIRELIASKGAILRFVTGVSYRLKIRGGFTTSLVATQGSFAEFREQAQVSACARSIELSAPDAATPYVPTDSTFRGCGSGARVLVSDVY